MSMHYWVISIGIFASSERGLVACPRLKSGGSELRRRGSWFHKTRPSSRENQSLSWYYMHMHRVMLVELHRIMGYIHICWVMIGWWVWVRECIVIYYLWECVEYDVFDILTCSICLLLLLWFLIPLLLIWYVLLFGVQITSNWVAT